MAGKPQTATRATAVGNVQGASRPLDIEQVEQLLAYLRQHGRVGADEAVQVRVLEGGVSNRTVWLKRAKGEAWVLKQALPKLRVPVDWYCDPSRIQREALGLRWLRKLAPPGMIPQLIFEDRPVHLLAMRAVPQPHENWKTRLLSGGLERSHLEQFARLLATIHVRAWRQRGHLANRFANTSFFESLRIEPYYGYTAEQVPAARAFLVDLVARTHVHRVTLVHGDYSPKNILIYRNRLRLLDHEVIHWGDPAFDVGFSLTHLLSKAHHLPAARAAFAQAAVDYWHIYHDATRTTRWGAQLEGRVADHTLGCLLARVAGRSQLEYLSAVEKLRQRAAVLALLASPPASVAALVERFIACLTSPS